MILRTSGFTLLELAVVIAIIAVLATVVFLNFISSKAAANEETALATVRMIAMSEETFRTTSGNGRYTGDVTVMENYGIEAKDDMAHGGCSFYVFTPGYTVSVWVYSSAGVLTKGRDGSFYTIKAVPQGTLLPAPSLESSVEGRYCFFGRNGVLLRRVVVTDTNHADDSGKEIIANWNGYETIR
ncbi:MAG: type II secretion system GspH family protein [Planctomycetota bacterium]|nr:type II secretion system GspH family protein [Planctomycetota bacterium]